MKNSSSYNEQALKYDASLMLSCPNKFDVLSKVTQFFSQNKIGVSECRQYAQADQLFLRLTWTLSNAWQDEAAFRTSFAELADELHAEFDVNFHNRSRSIGLYIAENAELIDGLLKKQVASSNLQVAFIASSFASVEQIADRYGVPFFLIENNDDSRPDHNRLIGIVQRYKPDFLALLNCQGKLGATFVENCGCAVFSVSSAMLLTGAASALTGDNDVTQLDVSAIAYQSGAKLLGATAFFTQTQAEKHTNHHEVTQDEYDVACLQGPIIDQQVMPVGHVNSLADVQTLVSEAEKIAFMRALKLLIEHRVLKFQQRTIIFD